MHPGTMNPGSLAGKAIVVTGAGRGIGAAIARLAAAEGAAVVVNDRDQAEAEGVAAELRAAGLRAAALVADIASWDGARGLMDFCLTKFGRLDGLVNNAGYYYMAAPHEEDEARLRTIVEVNVLGAAFCGIHASRIMRAQGGGAIVNITSGSHTGIAGQASYGMTKGAIASLTYAWALDFAGQNIRVNAVSPIGRSRMSEAARNYLAHQGGTPPPVQTIPPEQNAPLVCYLLADASAAVNGQVVRMQGRKLALMTHPAVLYPALERDSWTIADIHAAFEATLTARQLPVGMAALDATVMPYDQPYSASPR